MKSIVFINKNSGYGNADNYYKKHLRKFIDKNFSESVVYYLPCDNFDYIINEEDNNENNCLFIVGGDGSVSITIENIMINSDIDDLKIPIYICPFGSGNGLAKNLNINPYKLRLDGEKKYISPMEIKNPRESNYLSFLSQTWGIISDIDINTEFLRCIGDLRFYYGILKSIFFPKYYRGKLNFTFNNKEYLLDDDFLLFCASNAAWISSDFKVATRADIFKNEMDLIIIRKKLLFYERIKLIYYLINFKIDELDFVEYFKVNKYNLEVIDNNSCIARDGEILSNINMDVSNTNKKFLFYSF